MLKASFPGHFRTGPEWSGYWHDLSGLQNLPKLLRWLGHIVILRSCSSVGWKIPALAAITSHSFIIAFERWQLERWFLISSWQSPRVTISFTLLFSPQQIPPTPINEQFFVFMFQEYYWTGQGMLTSSNECSVTRAGLSSYFRISVSAPAKSARPQVERQNN